MRTVVEKPSFVLRCQCVLGAQRNQRDLELPWACAACLPPFIYSLRKECERAALRLCLSAF